MRVQDTNYLETVRSIFGEAPFIADLGIRLDGAGPGWCETSLAILPRHLQQDRVVHAGVQATMADHTAGGAGGTLVRPGETVLSAEFKLNFLRAAAADSLFCRAEVLKAGQTLIVAESWVYSCRSSERRLVSKATVTLAVVAKGRGA